MPNNEQQRQQRDWEHGNIYEIPASSSQQLSGAE
jgi:hypothetical protein